MSQLINALTGIDTSQRHNPTKKLPIDDTYLLDTLSNEYLESNTHNIHHSFPLESDISFENAFLGTGSNQHILPTLFDHNFIKNFSCINPTVATIYGKQSVAQNINFHVERKCDLANKPFFRLCLKKDLDHDETKHLMNLLSDCSFDYEIGGSRLLSMPKLLFNFIIGEKLNCGVEKLNAQEFINTYTTEEIKQRIVKFIGDGIAFNQKYYFEHTNSNYLDIPLLLDFYFYNTHIPMITSQYHNIRFWFSIPSHKVKLIEKYVSGIILMFEENVFVDRGTRRKLVQHRYEMLCMQISMYYFHCYASTVLNVDIKGLPTTKFIFVIIRRFEDGDRVTNTDHDVSQFPTITNVELGFGTNSSTIDENISSVTIDPYNIWVSQFTNIMVYGIACDYNKSMGNWIKTVHECTPVLDKMWAGNDLQENDYMGVGTVTNINCIDPTHLYLSKPVSHVKIMFDNFCCPANIEVITVNNNILRNLDGMCGIAYLN